MQPKSKTKSKETKTGYQDTGPSPAQSELICSSLEAGNSRVVAFGCADIPRSSFYEWLAKGRAAIEKRDAGGKLLPREKKLAVFVRAIEKAELECEQRLVNIIANNATDSSEDAKWLLERINAQRWATRQRTIDEAWEAALARMKKRLPSEALEHVLAVIADEAGAEVSDGSSFWSYLQKPAQAVAAANQGLGAAADAALPKPAAPVAAAGEAGENRKG